jgi:hypothetical protein
MTRIIVMLCIGIVALDAVESTITRFEGTPYVWFSFVQILVYAGIGFALRRRGVGFTHTFGVAAAVAFAEATAGQVVAVAIGSERAVPLLTMIAVIPFVVILDCMVVFAGFGIASIGRRARS